MAEVKVLPAVPASAPLRAACTSAPAYQRRAVKPVWSPLVLSPHHQAYCCPGFPGRARGSYRVVAGWAAADSPE